MTLGETPLSTFRLIILPLVMPGIVSSLLISFTISLDEFIIAFFLAGTRTDAAGLHLRPVPLSGRLPVIMALGTILVCLSIMLLASPNFSAAGALPGRRKDTGGFL
jgi:spermidine/putrescine transport system permease protein